MKNSSCASKSAIGAGAEYIFFYIGNKSTDLPDFAHAIDLPDVGPIINIINICFVAMGQSGKGSKSTKIDLIG